MLRAMPQADMPGQDHVRIGMAAEPAWLALQSMRWEPAGRSLLAQLGDGQGLSAVDVGCGELGWLRILSEWVGPDGSVTGTDLDDALIAAARARLDTEHLSNVRVMRDDLFRTSLPTRGFDLVHARFAVTPLDRVANQVATYVSLVRPGGWVALEDNDIGSWHFNPPAPAAERLIHLIAESFLAVGENLNDGRKQWQRLREMSLQPNVAAQILALEPGDPYLRLPIHFTYTLEPRLLKLVTADELESLRRHAEEEIASPERWGTTFTLIQTWARVP
jgi:ubiquinone/menaquinone biosynthesis C-methylase UbiE